MVSHRNLKPGHAKGQGDLDGKKPLHTYCFQSASAWKWIGARFGCWLLGTHHTGNEVVARESDDDNTIVRLPC